MLHDIPDGNQTHPNIDKRETRLKIRDHIKQKELQWKGELRPTHKWEKVYIEYLVLSYRIFHRN